jgi:hypothetical protein
MAIFAVASMLIIPRSTHEKETHEKEPFALVRTGGHVWTMTDLLCKS